MDIMAKSRARNPSTLTVAITPHSHVPYRKRERLPGRGNGVHRFGTTEGQDAFRTMRCGIWVMEPDSVECVRASLA